MTTTTRQRWLGDFDDDRDLLAELTAAVGEQFVVPDRLRETARETFSWHNIDEDLTG